MPDTTILVEKVPLNADKKALVATLFASEGYSLLREMIISRCIEAQIPAMQAQAYRDISDKAKDDAEVTLKVVRELSAALDLLDELQQKEDDWHLVNLKPSR